MEDNFFRFGGVRVRIELFRDGIGGFYECLDRCRYASQVIDEHIDVLATLRGTVRCNLNGCRGCGGEHKKTML